MILGILSDPHEDKHNAIPHVIAEFKKRGVEVVICPGDLTEAKHYDVDLFGGFSVYYALTENQCEMDAKGNCIRPKRQFMPPGRNWQYTMPGHRIIEINGELYYLGHKIPFEYYLLMSEEKFGEHLQEIRLQNDGLRYIFGGHTHVQTLCEERTVSMINSGAVMGSGNWGYEFAVLDTDTNQIIFGRVMPAPPLDDPFTVGVITDSLNVSRLDVKFWPRLRQEFMARGVSHVIHLGNIALEDIGTPEFADFTVHYNLLPTQVVDLDCADLHWQKKIPDNWNLINPEAPVVDILGKRFYVKLDLALEFRNMSESGLDHMTMKLRKEFPGTNYVLCGMTNGALYYEGQQVRVVNPGNSCYGHRAVTICSPRDELTFFGVPVDPLPAIA